MPSLQHHQLPLLRRSFISCATALRHAQLALLLRCIRFLELLRAFIS
jgi:hypothetical protein